MADLLDIAPSAAVEVVRISGQKLTVRSLGANSIGTLAVRFPGIMGILLGGFVAADVGSKLVGQFGAAVGPIIAAGCGHLGDEKAEHHADTAFLLEDQLKLVVVIIGITFPNGLGFFEDLVQQFAEMAKRLTGAAGEEAKKIYKVRLKTSPSPSPPLSDTDSPPNLQ
jgi:hypothetical protein